MEAIDWPSWWVLAAPAIMIALMAVCMASMRCVTRGTRAGADAEGANGAGGADLAGTGPHVPARFPDGPPAFEQFGTAQDKAEFDKFIAEHKRPIPPA